MRRGKRNRVGPKVFLGREPERLDAGDELFPAWLTTSGVVLRLVSVENRFDDSPFSGGNSHCRDDSIRMFRDTEQLNTALLALERFDDLHGAGMKLVRNRTGVVVPESACSRGLLNARELLLKLLCVQDSITDRPLKLVASATTPGNVFVGPFGIRNAKVWEIGHSESPSD
jgi:hypothetical protein